jgi:hypothetical protein
VDQQANRRARSAPGATLNPGRLNGSPGVTSFLKVTVPALWAYLRQWGNHALPAGQWLPA